MSEWVMLDVIDGIGPVAVKRRRPSEDTALLDHEADVLAAIDHPGVVRLVERRTEPDAVVTHFIGTHSLATAPALSIEDALALVAELAHTVEDLHRQGVRHGAIDRSHVLLGPGRRPVLCGFSGATLPDSDPTALPVAGDDIAAIGRVMSEVLAGHDGLEPIPGRRPFRTSRWQGYRQRALLSLADHCQADDPRSRPSAASLAATIDDLVDERPTKTPVPLGPRLRQIVVSARHPRQARLKQVSWPKLTRPGARPVIVGSLVVAGLVAGAFALRGSAPSLPSQAAAESRPTAGIPAGSDAVAGGPPTSPPEPSDPDTSPSTTTTPPAASTAPAPTSCPAGKPTRGADIDNDHCPDGEVTIRTQIATVSGQQFELGRPGDVVLAGDWDCDQFVTVIVVRPDPAALWHFPVWASPGVSSTPDLVATGFDPSSVDTRVSPEGCDQLFATADGSPAPEAVEIG